MDKQWPHERIVKELQVLFKTGVTGDSLAACSTLISVLLPEEGAPETDRTSKTRTLEAVLRDAIRQHSEGTNKTAEHIRAANELLGWTTRNDEEIRKILGNSSEYSSKTLSKLKTVDLTSLGARSVLAGAQFSSPLISQRSVRSRRPEIAKHLADAVQDILEDKVTLRKLNTQFHEGAKEEGQQGVDETAIDATASDKPRRRFTQRSALVVGTLVGSTIIAAVLVPWIAFQSQKVETLKPNEVQVPESSLAIPAPPVRQAEVRYTEGKGLNTFLGPGNTFPDGTPSNLDEGRVIAVVCQERNGQPIHDPLGDPNRYIEPWPVWDKLSSGLWVSDLYTDLPKIPGDTPPDGIARC